MSRHAMFHLCNETHHGEAGKDADRGAGHDVQEPLRMLLDHHPGDQGVDLHRPGVGEADQTCDLVVQLHHILHPQHPSSEHSSRP